MEAVERGGGQLTEAAKWSEYEISECIVVDGSSVIGRERVNGIRRMV
jgi:hypothetical protein